MISLPAVVARHGVSFGCIFSIAFSQPSLAEETQQLPTMTVEDEETAGASLYPIELQQRPLTTPDTAEPLRSAPGANVNGPLTGIAQYRGMYGDRINVQDGPHRVAESGKVSMHGVKGVRTDI